MRLASAAGRASTKASIAAVSTWVVRASSAFMWPNITAMASASVRSLSQ
jgi:hypothetical protein